METPKMLEAAFAASEFKYWYEVADAAKEDSATLSLWRGGKRIPPLRTAENIAKVLDIQLNGTFHKAYERDRYVYELERLGKKYSHLTPKDIQEILENSDLEIMRSLPAVPVIGTVPGNFPTIVTPATIGNAETYVGALQEYHSTQDKLIGLRVSGDSMSPLINDGDIVIVHAELKPDPGDIAAVLIGNEAVLKRIDFYEDRILLVSENPRISKIEILDHSTCRIIGKVIQSIHIY